MKTSLLLLALPTLLVTSPVLLDADAADQPTKAVDSPVDVRVVMQEKLQESQTLLRAVAVADFATMEKSAARVVQLSNYTNWYSRQTAEYELFLNEFRRNAKALQKAAADKNLDSASLAYVHMTLSCFDCHQYIRGPGRIATLPLPGASGRDRQ